MIEKQFKISCERHGNTYRACSDLLPGSPPVGIGKTKLAAKYNFILIILDDWKVWGKYFLKKERN